MFTQTRVSVATTPVRNWQRNVSFLSVECLTQSSQSTKRKAYWASLREFTSPHFFFLYPTRFCWVPVVVWFDLVDISVFIICKMHDVLPWCRLFTYSQYKVQCVRCWWNVMGGKRSAAGFISKTPLVHLSGPVRQPWSGVSVEKKDHTAASISFWKHTQLCVPKCCLPKLWYNVSQLGDVP